MRYIDADEVIKDLVALKALVDYSNIQIENSSSINACIGKIESSQTLDVKPVVHAHWEPAHPNQRTGKADMFVCSKCKRPVFTSWQKSVNELGYAFCPHCGAIIDEGVQNDKQRKVESNDR